ncbi:hypothetical protein BD410DRAFT_889052 [Rickenella mellea]|uniref:CsbD-like domain-containing protein n=1 Tax=Rickenella mellea TaxID=50990 RepID=A0A4Y7QBS1_9AGAM|nr:hypothetical protein BD410DRAFT_889052 [Rickenella mellea]
MLIYASKAGAPGGNYGQGNVGHHHHHHQHGGPGNVAGNTMGTGQQQMPGTQAGPGYTQNGVGGQGMDGVGAGAGYQQGGPKTTVQAAETETTGRGAGQYQQNDFANGQGTTGGVNPQGQFPASQANNTTAGLAHQGGINHAGLATGAAAAGTGAALGAGHSAAGTTTGVGSSTGTGIGATGGDGALNATHGLTSHHQATNQISAANSEHRQTAQTIGGKLQQAAGMLLSSDKMKADGLAREHGAKANNDIDEAQRLEQGAAAHRGAAVSHGAHPNQKNLGGGF